MYHYFLLDLTLDIIQSQPLCVCLIKAVKFVTIDSILKADWEMVRSMFCKACKSYFTKNLC